MFGGCGSVGRPSTNSLRQRLSSGVSLLDTLPTFLTVARAGNAWAEDRNRQLTLIPTAQPRFDYLNTIARGLLIEGNKSNKVQNARLEGAVPGTVGSGGALPTNCAWIVGVGSLAVDVATPGVVNGVPCCDIRLYGTTNNTGAQLAFAGAAEIAVVVADNAAYSQYLALVAGSLANVGSVKLANWHVGAGVTSAGPELVGSLTSALLRWKLENDVVPAATTNDQPGVLLAWANGVVVDITLRVGLPDYEAAQYVCSSPIMPPVGTPGVSSRSTDICVAVPTFVPSILGPTDTFALVADFVPLGMLKGNNQAIVQLDDGTTNNRLVLSIGANSAVVGLTVSVAGVTSQIPNISAYVPDALYRIVMRSNGVATACSANGGAVTSVAACPSVQLTALRLGNNTTNSAPFSGHYQRLRIITPAPDDATMRIMSA